MELGAWRKETGEGKREKIRNKKTRLSYPVTLNFKYSKYSKYLKLLTKNQLPIISFK